MIETYKNVFFSCKLFCFFVSFSSCKASQSNLMPILFDVQGIGLVIRGLHNVFLTLLKYTSEAMSIYEMGLNQHSPWAGFPFLYNWSLLCYHHARKCNNPSLYHRDFHIKSDPRSSCWNVGKLLKQASGQNMTFKCCTFSNNFRKWIESWFQTSILSIRKVLRQTKNHWDWEQFKTGQMDCLTCVSHQLVEVIIIWSSVHTTMVHSSWYA